MSSKRKNPFGVGDRVRLRDDYDGYFADFMGRDLTVLEAFDQEDGVDGPAVRIKEFREDGHPFHLLLARNFEPSV